MRRIRRLGLYTICFSMVVVVRLFLWGTTYQKIRAFSVRPCSRDPQPHRKGAVGGVVRCIRKSARFIPGASCLTQTLACQAVLSWRGIPSTIEIGVAKGEEEASLKAHAWLVWNGMVILENDHENLQSFRKINSLPTPSVQAAS
ncbi:lasso peptide biosynthesis B2 protein [Epibacterium ulvae]|uniref:lasso peptide biosynthesis B2 protein n=1 Tax=Epibacterium ulvae TaxID=1156985 RepID=UPI00248FDABD|nr:lasso peptide biosynthesis B2 protein [Epibacterium ulvae]